MYYCHTVSEGFITANYKGVISDNSPIIALMKITKSDLLLGFMGIEPYWKHGPVTILNIWVYTVALNFCKRDLQLFMGQWW